MTSVTIGESVTSIGQYAFSGCSGLTSVSWNAKNCANFSNETALFNGCTKITSFEFGDQVDKIPAYLCYGLSGLKSVTIPNSVTSIGGYAFSGCSGLTSVTIPNSVTSIGDNSFSGCSGLTSVTIPNSVTSIGGAAFYGCSSLAKVSLPTSIETLGDYLFSSTFRDLYAHWDDPINISESVFKYCYQNTILHVPEGAEKYYRARQGWKNFETIWEDAGSSGGQLGIKGDLNNDGSVDGGDVSILLEMVLSGE